MNEVLKRKDLFQNNEKIRFYHPKLGRIDGIVLSTEFLASPYGFTCNVLVTPLDVTVKGFLMTINEKFLKMLQEKALNMVKEN